MNGHHLRLRTIHVSAAKHARLLIGFSLLATGAMAASAPVASTVHASFDGTTNKGITGIAMADKMGENDNQRVRGEWIAERETNSPRVWVQIVGRSLPDVGWVPLPAGEPAGLVKGQEIHFDLRRDAGTLHFAGSFDGTGPGARGKGTFTFASDPNYRREMQLLGYRVGGDDQLLVLAWRDVSPGFVREIAALGYRDPSLDQLIELRSHAVTPGQIREINALGYRNLPVSRLVEFNMYDVTPAFIRELTALGYESLPAERLVEFRIQNVTPKLIRELAELGYRAVPSQQLVELSIQGVDPAFIRDLQKRGYRNLSVADLIEMRTSGAISHNLRRRR